MGIELQFCKMKSSENWLYNNVNIFNTPRPLYLRIHQINFVLCIFAYQKKKKVKDILEENMDENIYIKPLKKRMNKTDHLKI